MEDEGFKLQPSGKIFNGEIYKPTTTIPIFIKMNKVSGEIRTPNIIQRNNIEFLVQVSSTNLARYDQGCSRFFKVCQSNMLKHVKASAT